MRKFAANYLVSETGVFMKNGIVVAEEDGTAVQYVDTKNDLREIAQLSFYNGILMGGCVFVKAMASIPVAEPDLPVRSFVFRLVAGLDQVSIQKLVELGKQVQEQFPEMKIPEIMNEITEVLLANGAYRKENIQGFFLLNGVDLVLLQFTPRSRLKKIF